MSHVSEELGRFAASDDFLARMETAFGDRLSALQLDDLRQSWLDGTFNLPAIEIVDETEIGGAQGAYSAELNKIFLSGAFLATQTPEVIAGVVIEEYGHAIDTILNEGVDSAGDEGNIFARLVAGEDLSDTLLAALKAEDDSATAVLDGQSTAIEQAVPAPVAVTHASGVHTFSINDIIGGYDGVTYADDPTIIALGGTSEVATLTDKMGTVMSPIDSEFGFYVSDFLPAIDKVHDYDYAEGWAGNIKGDLNGDGIADSSVGLAMVNAQTDTFKSGQPFGTWAAGLGGNSVKASTEHYTVMAQLLSDQEVPDDGSATYPLDNDLIIRGGTYDGQYVADVLPIVGDVNGDGTTDIRDVLTPNESTTGENIAYSDDYSVTLKDDGKLLYRWGTEVKRPNDIRLDVKLDLPDEWKNDADLDNDGTADVQELNGGLGYHVTRAELVIVHDITNNPNDQVRPEDYENEDATGRGPSYYVVTDPNDPTNTLWVSPVDSYDGSGTALPSYFKMTDTGEIDMTAGGTAVYAADGSTLLGYRNVDGDGNEIGTVFRDLSLIPRNDAANLVFEAADLDGGFTNAWYTTTDRDPFEWSYDKYSDDPYRQVYEGFRSRELAEDAGYTDDDLVSGPRWRITANKFGQDIPGVEIPLEPNSQPPYQKDNIRYEVGELTTTTINLLDWEDTNGNGIQDDSPLAFSTGWTMIDPTRMDLDGDGLIDEGWTLVNGTLGAGDAVPTGAIFSAVTPNGQSLTADFFDTAIYLKGDRQDSAKYYNMQLVLEYDGDPTTVTGYDYAAASDGDVFNITPVDHIPVLEGTNTGDNKQDIPPDIDQPVTTTDPDFTSHHVFSTDDVTGTYDGLTQGDVQPGDPPVVDFSADPQVTKDGVELYPINSEFAFNVTDFEGAEDRDFTLDPEYEEGWVGDMTDADGNQLGLTVSDSPTDTFNTPALLGTWLVGMGGTAVKASTEHYSVMQSILSDQRYPGDPTALYPLDDDLVMIGGAYDGQHVQDILPIVGDVNGDGVTDIRDVLAPNESTITQDIAVSSDYSVTLKDDGKLLYRWGNLVKRPVDVRVEASLDLPDEWATEDQDTNLLPLYRITGAELVVDHDITNNPNDQIRPEDYENEAATGRLPTYTVDDAGRWVTTADFYTGDGTFLPTGTVLKDPALATAVQGTLLDQIGAMSEDLAEGYTAAWYTTQDRDPFEPTLDGDSYDVGPRWRLKSNKYGQDLPGVEIPQDPSAEPPPKSDELKYEVGARTQTVINLLDWETISPLTTSAGWQNGTGTTTINGLNLTENFDVAFYIKGDIKPVNIYSTDLRLNYEQLPIAAVGETVTGGAGDDVLVGQGGNTLTGAAGDDLFVLSYGAPDSPSVINSLVTDFQVGQDMLGLFSLGVSEATFDNHIVQTVVGGDLQIALDGYQIATLEGVTEALDLTDFQLLSQFSMPMTTIYGTPGDDTLRGDDYLNTIYALEGNDLVYAFDASDTIYGGAGEDTIAAGSGDDLVYGGDDNDTLYGADGDDTVIGGNGADLAYLGYGDDVYRDHAEGAPTGNDTVYAGPGNDTIYGGGGDDLFVGHGQNDVIYGYDGNDTIDGGYGSDTLYGSVGDDLILGGDHADMIYGGAGNDTADGGNGTDVIALHDGDDTFIDNDQDGPLGNDTVWGGDGNDSLIGGGGNDELHGVTGDDTIAGGAGDDVIYGGANVDSIDGGTGNDTIYGGTHVDMITAGLGNDVVDGGLGADLVYLNGGNDLYLDNDQDGPQGNDTVWAGVGNDTIQGGAGDDVFRGQENDDTIYGRLGNDQIFGGGGTDMLDGGAGNDTMFGGAGADTFVFALGSDRIVDFETGVDEIALDSALWTGTLSTTEVVSQFATTTAPGVLFDFGGGNTLLLSGLDDVSGLENDLAIL
ncbi:calcium-binding protein [Acidimangrovimonas pyrenivorans]|uniref:calcium-binding protein n=1 Tax=Acidimangrovimonas pyrenivorans TaxID=2030798 RepID=UPI00366BB3E1